MNTERYILFTGGNKKFKGYVKQSGHVVTLFFEGDIPAQSTARGFAWYINNASVDPDGDYSDFGTVYRWDTDAGIYQMSDDGSIYVPPAPPVPTETVTVTFVANEGGSLTGETSVTVPYGSTMADVVVPEAAADDHYDFAGWSPAIIESDALTANRTYTANFVLKYEYTIEGRVSTTEANVDYLAMETGVELL